MRRVEIAAAVSAAGGEQELGGILAAELCDVFEAEIAFVAAGESENEVSRMIAAIGLTRAQAMELFADPICEEAIAAAAPILADGFGGLASATIHAIALAAYRTEGGRPLLVGVARRRRRPFDAIEAALLESIAESAGKALERLWAYEERDRRAVQQAALVRGAKALNRSLEIEEVLSALCRETSAALGGDKTAAYLGNEADGFYVTGTAGLPESFRGFRLHADEGLGGIAVREGRTLTTRDYQAEKLAPQRCTVLDDVRTAIAVPLRWEGRIHGFLSVGFTSDRRLGRLEIELVEGFAELAALACANAERHAAVQRAAAEDPLTGCLNQAAFRRAARARIGIAQRDGTALTMLLLDLDGFKHVNDSAGHPAGDSLLREVGSIILDEIRGEDLAGRYGGDEFGILLPDMKADRVAAVSRRLDAELAGISLPCRGTLSCCTGVAAWQPGENAQSLIDRADDALLDAKRQGRGVTVVNADPPHSGRLASPFFTLGGPESQQRRRVLDDRLQGLAGRIGLRIAREWEPAQAAEVAAGETAAALEAVECAVFRVGASGELETCAMHAGGPAAKSRPLDPRREDGVVQRCLRKRHPVAGSATVGRERHDPQETLAVPVFTGDDVWGVLACRAEGGGFGIEDVKLAETIADYLGTSVGPLELIEELRTASAARD